MENLMGHMSMTERMQLTTIIPDKTIPSEGVRIYLGKILLR